MATETTDQLVIRYSHYFSELTGTLWINLVALGTIVEVFGNPRIAPLIPNESLRLLLVLLIIAGALILVIYSPVGKISGAHLNPVVSLAFWLEGQLDARDLAGFAVAQTVGALAGAAIVHLAVGDLGNAVHFGMTRPADGLHPLLAASAEAAATFGIISLIFYCLHHERLVPRLGWLIGAYIVAVAFFLAPLTGASMNPVRSLAPALITGDFSGLWIYFL